MIYTQMYYLYIHFYIPLYIYRVMLTCWRLRTLYWQFAAHLTLCGLDTLATTTTSSSSSTTHSSALLCSTSRPWFGPCIMYDMIGVFVAASSGIMALNFFLCGRSQGPQCVSLIYWLSVPQTKVLLGIRECVWLCAKRGDTWPGRPLGKSGNFI